MHIDPKYGSMDEDTKEFFKHFNEPKDSLIIEVGANQEYAAFILTDNGAKVLGVDLMPFYQEQFHSPNYFRIVHDFVPLVENGILPKVNCTFSLSAVEHAGLGTYPGCPGVAQLVEDYDVRIMKATYDILKPNGTCYITVPYGKDFIVCVPHHRVYNSQTLQDRIIQNFQVEVKEFFKSGGCACPDKEGIVSEEDANSYNGDPPHITVFLKLRKV